MTGRLTTDSRLPCELVHSGILVVGSTHSPRASFRRDGPANIWGRTLRTKPPSWPSTIGLEAAVRSFCRGTEPRSLNYRRRRRVSLQAERSALSRDERLMRRHQLGGDIGVHFGR